jgi:hypothetical protein
LKLHEQPKMHRLKGYEKARKSAFAGGGLLQFKRERVVPSRK